MGLAGAPPPAYAAHMRKHQSETMPASEEWVQEKFRYAVVRSLARIEARARLLQLSEIVNSQFMGGPVRPPADQEADIEAMVSEVSEEVERKILRAIYGGRDAGGTRARRGRIPNWSDWEI
jgi:hypothetical protein